MPIKNRKILIALFLAFVTSGCTTNGIVAPELLVPLEAPADLVPAVMGNIHQIKLAEGAIVPYSEGLSFLVEGTPLDTVHVTIGQSVRKGDWLASLDTTAFDRQYAELNKRLAENEESNSYSNALKQYTIDALQVEYSFLSPNAEVERRLVSFDLKLAQQELAYAKKIQDIDQEYLLSLLEKMDAEKASFNLFAPFDGVVMHIENVQKGDYPNVNKPFIYLADLTKMTIQCTTETTSFFSQSRALQATIGENTFAIEMLQYTHEELMAFYFASITPPIRFRPLETSVQLTADKRALIEVKGEEIENTLIVLPNAVHQEISDGTGYQFYVYTDNNGARERTNIKCGLRSDVAVEVLEGLEEGDMVYVD